MEIGFEVICCSTECVYNDSPGCSIHTIYNPIRLGKCGLCLNFKKGGGEV